MIQSLSQVINKVIEEDANGLLEDFPLQTNMDEKLGAIGNLFGLKKGANMVLSTLTSRPPERLGYMVHLRF